MVALFTILFPGIGLVMLGVLYGLAHDGAVLKDKGVPIVTQITDLRIEHGRGTSYRVSDQYRPPPPPGERSEIYPGAGVVSEQR
jgi:hypothetical protein